MLYKRRIRTSLILLIVAVSLLGMFKYVSGSRISELLESHYLGDNRRLEVYFVMSHATIANFVDVYLIDDNNFIWKKQVLLEARSVGSVHIELISDDSAMAYIYSYGHALTDSVVLVLTGDQETIHWRK